MGMYGPDGLSDHSCTQNTGGYLCLTPYLPAHCLKLYNLTAVDGIFRFVSLDAYLYVVSLTVSHSALY